MKDFFTLDDIEVQRKTVLLRVDFNMPLDKNTLEILDTTRMKLVLPTIKDLLDKEAKVVILAHQGRKGSWDFISLERHAKALQELLGQQVRFVDDVYGERAQNAIRNLSYGEVLMLDNVRQFDGETEKKSPAEHAQSALVQQLYPLADVFVNDAFAAAHRKQCSLVGFTEVLPSCAGRLLEKELMTLDAVVTNPSKPSVFLFGGAKFSDVIVTIDRLLDHGTADTVLLTGLPANAFLKAQGVTLGSRNEEMLAEEGSEETFDGIKRVLSKYEGMIHLPVDFAVEQDQQRQEITREALPSMYPLLDIGDRTIAAFKKILGDAKTVFLSGPCGVFENPLFQKGTREIFSFIAESDAFSIVGGGHTVAAVEQLHLRDKMSHISTGGGSLEKFMMGEKLPVVEALKQAKQKNLVKV